MFTNPLFKDVIGCFTLKFKNPKLESFYQKTREEDYLRRPAFLCLLLISVTAILSLTLYYAYNKYFSEYPDFSKEAWGFIISDSLLFIGIIFELLVNCCQRCNSLRSIPLVICSLLSAAVLNTTTEARPVFRSG